ncbi:XTP/dITP diphosphatase [Paenibacillus larvae]|uniref:XTP/dITP diphosphatase n=1 Tax=Paenibacillus larvae TaxID=1464 RepID=UPI002282F17D|nr:XTP/dITP diphosphatase [Paenibacillus larvae]MCY9510675.1 XTP/dITP diphosphatase [Paenibacillus larvae]MCY9524008.1 XTP/dITP diphosphatase [Paenibacillus larvae]
MPQTDVVVIATGNKGKLKEFAQFFGRFGKEVRSLADYRNLPEIIEDGNTFAENARIKAELIARHLNVPTLADDSGLCVDVLHGAPGVYSARFAGEHGNDEANNAKLLAELTRVVPEDKRQPLGKASLLSPAQFVCALSFAEPSGEVLHTEGVCEGFILNERRGEHGFGYDPLFYLPDLDKTMAELTTLEKSRISHRSIALKQLAILYEAL